ncbi:MAG: YqeG family HAD IIIA-type phosphatase [Leptolyngbyaceae bacterium]|nr:YqeG family HAD IIIA-type phosphatase [Leptolyngbyaceae bacterium]
MVIGKFLQPDLVLGDSVTALTPEILQKQGLLGIVLDVDETLVPMKAAVASDGLHAWMAELKPHFKIWLVSNNVSENRIGGIARALDVPYISGALKPSRRKLNQAVTAMNLPANQIAMVGDRLMTDVLVGNRLGMFTILVDPIVDPTVAVRRHPIRNIEVLISKALGVSLRSPTLM